MIISFFRRKKSGKQSGSKVEAKMANESEAERSWFRGGILQLRGIITDSEKNSVTSPSYADYKYVVFTFIFTLEPPWKNHFSHLRGLGSMKTIFFWKCDVWTFHKILIFFDVFL